VEYFPWLYPLFNERLETRGGRTYILDRPGLGITLSEQARAWTVDQVRVDAPR
jgi:L-talarate/galactarate dehydratase